MHYITSSCNVAALMKYTLKAREENKAKQVHQDMLLKTAW
jgi:hypothetical protein